MPSEKDEASPELQATTPASPPPGGSGAPSASPLSHAATDTRVRRLKWKAVRVKAFGVEGEEGVKDMAPLRSRRGHSLAVVTRDDRLLLFGGRDNETDKYSTELVGLDFLGATAESLGDSVHFVRLKFNPEEPPAPPQPAHKPQQPQDQYILLGNKVAKASFHSHTMVVYGPSVFLYGGFATLRGTVPGSLPFWDQHFYQLTLKTQTWKKLTTLPKGDPRRRGHTAVVHKHFMYVFGGWGPEADWWRNDIDRFDLEAHEWKKQQVRGILRGPSVSGHTAVVYNNEMVVFGGYIDLTDAVETYQQQQVATSPSAVKSPSSTFSRTSADELPSIVEVNNNSTVDLFKQHTPANLLRGHLGEAGSVLYLSNAVFVFSFETLKWVRKTCTGAVPRARAHHTATVHNDLMIVIGGNSSGNVSLSDVCVLNLRTWLWVKIAVPGTSPLPPIAGHTTTICHGHLVVIGGSHFSEYHRCVPAEHGDNWLLLGHTAKGGFGGSSGMDVNALDGKLDPSTGNRLLWSFGGSLRDLEAAYHYQHAKVRTEILRDVSVSKPKLISKDESICAISRLLPPPVKRPEPKPEGEGEGEEQEEEEKEEKDDEEEAPRKYKKGEQRQKLTRKEYIELHANLYGRIKQREEARQKAFENKFLKPMVERPKPGTVLPLSKLNHKFHDEAVKIQQSKRDQRLGKNIQTWEGGVQGKWKAAGAGWKEEEEKVLKKIVMRAKGQQPNVPEGANDALNRRFYEDRKPTGEVAVRKRQLLFTKHDGMREIKVKGAFKADGKKVAELNARLYAESVQEKNDRVCRLTEKYVTEHQPRGQRRREEEWSETVERLYTPKKG